MKVIEYRFFDFIFFDVSDDVLNRDDIIASSDIKSFIDSLRHLPVKKLEYLKYWHIMEHQRKSVIEAYDEITERLYEIEKDAENNREYKTFVLRMKNVSKNYLRESDISVEFEKIMSSILSRINENEKEFNKKFDSKLESLYKRTEIVITRISEYCHQKHLNPNLKIQNKIGYSLSDVNVY